MVLFDNYDTDRYEEDAREYLEESGDGYTESELYNLINLYIEEDYEWLDQTMKKLEGPLIVSGSVGRWDGKYSGSQIYSDWSEFIREFGKDCDYFKIYTEKGKLYVKCSHHDGTNFCEVKTLTDRGQNYLENWEYDLDARTSKYPQNEVMRRLFTNSRYAKCPQIALA